MKSQLLNGAIWIGSAKIMTNLMGFISTIILAKVLAPQDFGLVAIVATILAIVEAITDLSLNAALVSKSEVTEDHLHTAWTLNFIRGLVMLLIFVIGAPFVADTYHDSRLINIMYVIGASIFLTGLANPKVILFTRNLVFKQDFTLAVSQKLSNLVVSVTIALVFRNYWAIVAGIVAAQLTNLIVGYLIISYRPKFKLTYIRDIWSFSIWVTLGKIVNTINFKIDGLLLANYYGAKSLAYYSVGDNLASLPTTLAIQPIESVLFPGYSLLKSDMPRLRFNYQKAQALLTAVALPIGFLLSAVSDSFVLLLLGEKWVSVIDVIKLISIVYVLQTISSQAYPLALALGKTKMIFKRDSFLMVIRLPIIFYAILENGLMGLIYARLLTGLLGLFVNMYLIKFMLNLTVFNQIKNSIRSIVSVLLMYIFIVGAAPLFVHLTLLNQLLIKVLLGTIVYIGLLFGLWLTQGKPEGPETIAISFAKKILKLINKN